MIQGCCASKSQNEGQNFPYDAQGPEDSSSRAIATESTHPLETTPSQLSTALPTTGSRSSRHRGYTAPGEQINAPLRRHIWTSKRQWTRSQLDKERREFFETRVTGHTEIWATLKSITELLADGDTPTAQTIADAAGITVPTGDLKNGVYDEAGNLYQLPAHIISDPQNIIIDSVKDEARGETSVEATEDEDELERKREEKGKAVIVDADAVRVKARLSDRGGPDVIVSVGKDQAVRSVIRGIREEANVSDHL